MENRPPPRRIWHWVLCGTMLAGIAGTWIGCLGGGRLALALVGPQRRRSLHGDFGFDRTDLAHLLSPLGGAWVGLVLGGLAGGLLVTFGLKKWRGRT